MTTYECGCVNTIDLDSGVLHCVQKCAGHIEELANQKQDCLEYYESLGCLKNGVPQNRKYIGELVETLKDLSALSFVSLGANKYMTEIGCGLGMYVPFFLSCNWNYDAVEISEFAANWVSNAFDVSVEAMPLADFWFGTNYSDLVFAAHIFEHLHDMPTQMQKTYDHLADGGRLILIVPDDTDPINPDHWWFFNVKTLHALLEKIGFKNIRSTTRKIIDRENFIYCVAEK